MKLYYRVDELQNELGLSKRTIREHITSGRLKASKVGRSFYVSRESLDEFFNDKRIFFNEDK